MINPRTRYPGQVIQSDPSYPYGRAKPKVSSSDNTGTPLHHDWLNDVWGFQQAAIVEAGLVPDGNTDRVGSSQMLEAIERIIKARIEAYQPTRVPIPLNLSVNEGDRFEAFSASGADSAFSIRQKDVTTAGILRFEFSLPFVGMRLKANGLRLFVIGASGHAAMPAFKPTVELGLKASNQSAIGDATELVSSFVDPTTVLGTYEIKHIIQPTLAARNIAASDKYYLKFLGESGTNAVVGLQLLGAYVELEPVP